MSPADAAFLHLEDDLRAMHNLTLAVFAGPEPAFEDLVQRVRERVGLVPRCSQRVMEVPLGLERPVWVNDPHFSVEYHVRHTALAPGDKDQALAALIGRVLSQRLDRTKPLWELWMVHGLDDGRWGLLSKMHYAAIDGVSGTDVLALITDDLNTDGVIGQPRAEALPSPGRLLLAGVSDLLFDPIERYRATRRAFTRPGRLAAGIRAEFTPAPAPGPLRGPIGPHRRWAGARLSLADLREARARHGGTTNDAVLAAMCAGLRTYLVRSGAEMPDTLHALVPVALTPGGAAFTNQVTALELELPVGLSEPSARHASIVAQTTRLMTDQGAVPGDVLRTLPSLATATLGALGLRAAIRVGSKRDGSLDTVVVNVPGVDHDVCVLDRPLVETYPVVPLAAKVRVAIGAVSHGANVFVGVTGDWDSMPEVGAITGWIEDGVRELIAPH